MQFKFPARTRPQLVTSPFEIIVGDAAKVEAVLASAADSSRIRSFSIIAHMYENRISSHSHSSFPQFLYFESIVFCN